MGGRLVGTADVHYLRREDYHHHSALLCVQTKSTLAQPKLSFDTNEFFLKDTDGDGGGVRAVAGGDPEHARDRRALQRRDRARPPADPALPDARRQGRGRLPARAGARGPARAATATRCRPRRSSGSRWSSRVIAKMGFSGYFLIVWDFVKFAKDSGIAVGPGRGSAAGSIVSYALNITEVDPLAYDLLFERFLNAERVSMPDIDIDFSVKGRDRVMRYVADKYGARLRRADRHLRPHVPARGHARRRARARLRLRHGRPAGEADPGPDHGPAAVVRGLPEAGRGARDARCAEDPQAKQIVDVAQGLEGIVRNSSIHAAAVVIATEPLTNIVPLQLAEDTGKVDEDGNKLLQHGHAVLDEADRGARPAQDGLPRPAQPRRDRVGARHHRAVHRRAAGHGHAAARRLEDLRDARRAATRSACSSSSPTACATRCARSSRPSSRTSSRSSRSTARARCATSTPTRATSASPTASPTSTSACARSPSPPTR